MTDALQDAAWGNRPVEAIKEARLRAKANRASGDIAGAHTMMLSAYIGSMNQIRGDPSSGRLEIVFRLFVWGVLAEYHSASLCGKESRLDFNQMDVLSSWLISTARHVPYRELVAHHFAGSALLEAEAGYKVGKVSAHQLAISHITYARVILVEYRKVLAGSAGSEVRAHVKQALALEGKIRSESDQPYALRQLVRVLKGAGELEYTLGSFQESYGLLSRAIALAEGEADTKSQAEAIRRSICRKKEFVDFAAQGM